MANKTDVLQALELRRQEKHEEHLEWINDLQRKLNSEKLLEGIKAIDYCKQTGARMQVGGVVGIEVGGVPFTTDFFMFGAKELREKLEEVQVWKNQIDKDHRRLKKEVLLYGVTDDLVAIVKEF